MVHCDQIQRPSHNSVTLFGQKLQKILEVACITLLAAERDLVHVDFFKWDARPNLFSHFEQLNGFSPVWIRS